MNLKRLWEAFKKVMHAFGKFNSALLLTVIYFTIFLPLHIYGLLADPLDKRGRKIWRSLNFQIDENWLRRQF